MSIINKSRSATRDWTLLLILILLFSNCKKFVTVNPPVTGLTNQDVFQNDATAAATLTGIYTQLSGSNFTSGGLTSMSLFPALSADELLVFGTVNPTYDAYSTNKLTNNNTGASDFWTAIYPTIYEVNSAIQGLSSSTGLSPAVKQQLLGEAYFMRAFCYFYLVNLYGAIPLVTGTDYTVNRLLSRSPTSDVWPAIIGDLTKADALLSTQYLQADAETPYQPGQIQKVRPTKWAAEALLARVYLYTGDYKDAVLQADSVIGNSALFSLNSLDSVFLANSNEAIWQLQPISTGYNTQDAILFILPSAGPGLSFPVYLDSALVAAFEPTDQRLVIWVGSVSANGMTYYFPYKYKVNAVSSSPPTEYEMVLRLGELYLIRAEAEANGAGGGLAAGMADVDTIRSRAMLGPINVSTQTDLLTAIYHERQVELFTEWGNRWLDLKRWGTATTVLSAEKANAVDANQLMYPIPLTEVQRDPSLVQNLGY